jgi:hypothetical protein
LRRPIVREKKKQSHYEIMLFSLFIGRNRNTFDWSCLLVYRLICIILWNKITACVRVCTVDLLCILFNKRIQIQSLGVENMSDSTRVAAVVSYGAFKITGNWEKYMVKSWHQWSSGWNVGALERGLSSQVGIPSWMTVQKDFSQSELVLFRVPISEVRYFRVLSSFECCGNGRVGFISTSHTTLQCTGGSMRFESIYTPSN